MSDVSAVPQTIGLAPPSVRLTELAHGGGCGCKLSPAVLNRILSTMPATAPFADLLVGTETSDDAAVWRLNDTQALVATTDFFTPIVDDPDAFGRIAATNALSDVYAMGGQPILALALVGMPVGKLPDATVQAIVAGGAAVCAAANIPIAGGHSIDSPEPIYGLVALGLVDPARILRNSTARPGDRLILTKGIGIGIFSAALKQGRLSPEDYATMLASTQQLNDVGPALAARSGVHAATDVTGFGLLGHLLEMCRGAGLTAELRVADVPVLPGALTLAEAGVGTGGAQRNWDSYGAGVTLRANTEPWRRGLLCDPQTSGGLLLAVAPDAADAVLALLHERRFGYAAAIGRFVNGSAVVMVR